MFLNDLKSLSSFVVRGWERKGVSPSWARFGELKSVSTELRSALSLQAKYSDDGDSEDGDADGNSKDGDVDDNNGGNDCSDDRDRAQGGSSESRVVPRTHFWISGYG